MHFLLTHFSCVTVLSCRVLVVSALSTIHLSAVRVDAIGVAVGAPLE